MGPPPTPALVKQILTSTATDLGVPATEQGSGLVNTYKAVLLAQSVGSARNVGQSLLLSQTQLSAIGTPGSTQSWPVTVTNTGELPQVLAVSGRTFGDPQNVQKGSVTLTDGKEPAVRELPGHPEQLRHVHLQSSLWAGPAIRRDCLRLPRGRWQQCTRAAHPHRPGRSLRGSFATARRRQLRQCRRSPAVGWHLDRCHLR